MTRAEARVKWQEAQAAEQRARWEMEDVPAEPDVAKEAADRKRERRQHVSQVVSQAAGAAASVLAGALVGWLIGKGRRR